MPLIKGRQTYCAIGVETPRLTANNTPNKFYPFKAIEANVELSYIDDDSAFANRVKLLERIPNIRSAKFSIEIITDADLVADFLYYMYGQNTTVQDATTGAFTHTFGLPVNSVEAPTFTLYHSNADAGNKRLRGCVIDTLEFSFADSGESTLKIEGMALDEEDVAVAPTLVLAKPSRRLLAKNIIAGWNTSVAGLATIPANQIFKLTSLNVKFSQNVQYDPSFSADLNNNILTDGWETEVSFTSYIENSNFYNFSKGGLKRAYRFDLTNLNSGFIGTSTILRPRIAFDIANSAVEVVYKKEIDNYVVSDCKIKPEFGVGSQFSLRTIVQNAVATLI